MKLNPSTSSRRHIMTVDVEDYFMVEAFADCVSNSTWDSWPSRVVVNTHKALDLFDNHQTKATFFVLGWVADKFPLLVKEIHARGHELACHSYWHRAIYKLTPDEFRSDTRQAKNAIEQIAGCAVIGYRAPSWSITKQCLWAIGILAEEGFVYDSSIFPIRHDLYGVPNAKRTPYLHQCKGGRTLQEYPPATIRIAGMNFPAAGGGYLRLFPLTYTKHAIQAGANESQSVVVYFHPWELDPEQPRIQGKLKSRFRHYTNLDLMERRLARLLETYSFQPFREMLNTSGDEQAQLVQSI
jgi:polysaccharide deacetylase family protein (PEP-CTERM system associated)